MRTKKRRKQRKRSIQFLSNNDIHSHNISFYEEMSRYLSGIVQTQSRVEMVNNSIQIQRLGNGWNMTVHSFGLSSFPLILKRGNNGSFAVEKLKNEQRHVSASPQFPSAKRFSQHLQCSTCWAREAFSSPTSTPRLSNLWALHMCQIKTSHCNFTNWSMHTTHQSINWNHFEFNTAKAGSKSWISWTSRMWIESFNFVLGFDWSVVEVVYPEARPAAGPLWLDLLTHCKMPAQGQHIPSLRPIFTRDRYLKSQRKAQTWLPNKQNMFHHAILYVLPVASYQYRLTFDSRLGSASCGSCLRHAIWSFGSSQPTFFAKVL